MADVITLNAPRPRLDRELLDERDRLEGKVCRRPNGERGYVSEVYREGLACIAKFWRDGHYDPIQSHRLEPSGGRAA